MFLGIDLGTSGVKILVLSADDAIICQASAPLDCSIPQALWSEQDPKDWWAATNTAMAELKATYPEVLAQVSAIGLSGQMHGATLLDEHGQIIRPAILWNDGRSYAECLEIEAAEANTRNITGNIAMPGFTAPKLAWIKKHEPENFKKTAKILLPKDYLRWLMSGDYASDMSDSAGTLWLDVKNRDWSDDMLAATELTRAHMPSLYEGTEITGRLLQSVAKDWGMPAVPIIAGGGDNAAGAAGIGVIEANQAFISLGTSGVYFVANDRYRPNPDSAVHTFCHCIPNTWHQMSVILSAASCLTWITKLTGFSDEQALLDEVEKLDFSIANQTLFLPYLSGERTPHNNPNAKGVFFGMGLNTTPAELGRAVLEGVAFAFADGQQALLDAGTQIDDVTVIGGGAKSTLWGEILASVLQRPLSYRKGGEVGPAFGAARLARIGYEKTSASAVCRPAEVQQTIQANQEMQSYYALQHLKFQALYQSLKNQF